MKIKNIKWIAAVLITVVMISCKKKEDVSQVVTVPTIALIGAPVSTTTTSAGTYADPGATFTDVDGSSRTVNHTAGAVDLSTAGFYSLKYEVKTKYGYAVSARRLVLVTDVSPSFDYSGIYARTSNLQEVNITKVGTGLYTTDNVGGVAGNSAFIFDVYFGQINDSTVVVPLQDSPIGEIYCTNAALVIAPPDTTIQWKVINSSFGTSLRKFTKQ